MRVMLTISIHCQILYAAQEVDGEILLNLNEDIIVHLKMKQLMALTKTNISLTASTRSYCDMDDTFSNDPTAAQWLLAFQMQQFPPQMQQIIYGPNMNLFKNGKNTDHARNIQRIFHSINNCIYLICDW